MIEHRGLAPQADSKEARHLRSKYYNDKFGPFRLHELSEPEQNESDSVKVNSWSTHYNDEWLRWMDKHPNGETRVAELPTSRSKNGELDENSGLSGPHIVVVGASHAGVAFVDKVRKTGFVGRLTVFDREVGGPLEGQPRAKGF